MNTTNTDKKRGKINIKEDFDFFQMIAQNVSDDLEPPTSIDNLILQHAQRHIPKRNHLIHNILKFVVYTGAVAALIALIFYPETKQTNRISIEQKVLVAESAKAENIPAWDENLDEQLFQIGVEIVIEERIIDGTGAGSVKSIDNNDQSNNLFGPKTKKV